MRRRSERREEREITPKENVAGVPTPPRGTQNNLRAPKMVDGTPEGRLAFHSAKLGPARFRSGERQTSGNPPRPPRGGYSSGDTVRALVTEPSVRPRRPDAAFRNGLSAPLPPPRDTTWTRAAPVDALTLSRRHSASSVFFHTAVGHPQRRGWTRGSRQRRQDPRREHSREGGPHTPRHLAISRRMQPLVMAARPTPSQ